MKINQLRAKNWKPSHWGSIAGVPDEMATGAVV